MEKQSKFNVGQEVLGTIINVTSEAIYLEVGETKAVIYPNDMANYVDGQKLRDLYFEGGEFKALVKQLAKDKRTGEDLLILSTKLYNAKDALKVFDELKESEEIIKAKVVFVNKAGCNLTYKGHEDIRIFLPLRNIYLSEKALYQLKGELIDVVVTEVDHERISVVVSNSIAQAKQRRARKQAALQTLEVGQILEGEVQSITDFGAFVKIGELTGLLHKSELDYRQVKNVADFLKVGQKINVKIIRLEGERIALSVKALHPHPWDILKEQYHVGDVFEGEVTKLIDAGLIVKLTNEYSGLMPNVEFSWRTNERPTEELVGQTLSFKVINIDSVKKRVSLSHRETIENLWKDIKLKADDVINVEIASIGEKGAIVNYQTISGFLPVNEVTDAKRIQKVDEVYNVGDKVDALVLDCDPGLEKLVVSVKRLEAKKERAEFDQFLEKQEEETPTTTLADLFGEDLDKFSE